MTVAQAADRLARILETAPTRLAEVSELDAGVKSGPGRWAPKEILGHLIDSASNNHQRFVRAQLQPKLEDPSYDQEPWVAAQSYLKEPWVDLVAFWLLYNRHLLHVMRNVRGAALETPISIRGASSVPLSQVMIDYVSHLEHHLAQIFKP